MFCYKCEHPVHESQCTDIEGKILGVDRECTCTMTATQNKEKKAKIDKREGKKTN